MNGVRASNSRRESSERLVRQYLGLARQGNHAAQSYGGSTGGAKSANIGLGTDVLRSRGREIGEKNRIFREAGSGALGARQSIGEMRNLPGSSLGI